MKRIIIFCEGITDQVFIADCLAKFYNITVTRPKNKSKVGSETWSFGNNDSKIISTDGCDIEKLRAQKPVMTTNIQQYEGINLIVNSLKRALNTYTYSLNHAKNERERNYKDAEFWNLDTTQNSDLKKFKNFLDIYFLAQ